VQIRKCFLSMLVVLVAAIMLACGNEPTSRLVDDIGLGQYTDTTLAFPPMRYANGETTINDRCPVRKSALNPRLSPLFVNGKPLGFC
jgi:hypothetical protein